eukprot:gene11605-24298_t
MSNCCIEQLVAETLIRTSYNERGNELTQFHRYLNLTGHKFDLNFFASNCTDVPDHGDLMACNHALSNDLKNMNAFPSRWEKEIKADSVSVDCSYSISNELVQITSSNTEVTFDINQASCKSNYIEKGGSSFDINIQNDKFLATCGVHDLFNNIYNIKCILPLKFHEHYAKNPNCLNVTILLEYEHFDAFETRSIPETFNLAHYIHLNHKVCTKDSSSLKNSQIQTSKETTTTTAIIQHTQNISIMKGIWVKNIKNNGVAEFEFENVDGGPLDKQSFDACLARQSSDLIGESHQRYTWNYLVYKYLDGQKTYINTLEQKHGDIAFSNISFTTKYLFPKLAAHIESLSCPAPNQRLAIAIQTGAWDLGSTPLRNIMLNPKYAPALLKAIEHLKNKECSRRIHVVFVLTMPYPQCNKDDRYCRGHLYWKTNYAISALNSYIVNELTTRINYPNLHILDSSGIMMANRREYDCMNHFLCRHGGRQQFRVATTAAGISLANEMMKSLCANNF